MDPQPPNPNPPLFNFRHALRYQVFFLVAGVVIGCVALAYSYLLLQKAPPVVQPTVAGSEVVRAIVPQLTAGAPAPDVKAATGILIDPATGYTLWQSNPSVIRPLASLTKLVTVGVFLQTQPDLQAAYTIPSDFNVQGITNNVEPGTAVSRLSVASGSKVSYHDLLFASLISSANNAAIALGKIVGPDVVDRMNLYAAFHGAPSATFIEPSGLNPKNTATARDVALLAHAAFTSPLVADATTRPTYDLAANGKVVRVVSTDKLLGHDGYTVMAGKTGYLQEAGYNLALQTEKDGHALLLVLLGEPTSADRFADADALFQWAYANTQWVEVTQ